MALSGDDALALAKSYTKKTAEGMGAVKGQDGFSPIAKVTKSGRETKISITDKNGETKATVYDGADGTDGRDGVDGINGTDGFSPTITVNTNTESEYTLNISDKNGEFATPNLKGKDGADGSNGKDGEDGRDGADGADGQDGFSPVIMENPDNTEESYRLDITDKNRTFTTPNLKGTDNYERLKNKPSINDVILSGNVTLEAIGVTKAILDALGDITKITFQPVESFEELPLVGEDGAFYLVPNAGSENNNYDEYIWDKNNFRYELLGTIQNEIDLSGYIKSTDIEPMTNEEVLAIIDDVFL